MRRTKIESMNCWTLNIYYVIKLKHFMFNFRWNETKKRKKKKILFHKKQESFHLIQLKFTFFFLRNFGVDNVCGSVHISANVWVCLVPVFFIYECKTLNSSAFDSSIFQLDAVRSKLIIYLSETVCFAKELNIQKALKTRNTPKMYSKKSGRLSNRCSILFEIWGSHTTKQ